MLSKLAELYLSMSSVSVHVEAMLPTTVSHFEWQAIGAGTRQAQ